jgi:hypothetical protein
VVNVINCGRCQLFEEAIRSERIVEVGGPG